MNRIDRLINILLTLQSRKFVSTKTLAEKYELSIRTVYRDIKALNKIGVPIHFEPNKGYRIMEGYFLPPLLFTIEEANALLLLQVLASQYADESIIKNSNSALEKIKAVLKYKDWAKFENISSKINIYTEPTLNNGKQYLSIIQNAIIDKIVLNMNYTDAKKNQTQRKIESIGLIFYTNQWHLLAWCHLRKQYRDFKVNNINQLLKTPDSYQKEHSFTIQDYMKKF